MKQRIPINSITSKLVLKSMYASCSTGPFFADHYSHRFEKTQLKFRQEKWFPVKIYLVLSEMRYERKINWSKTETESSVKSFYSFWNLRNYWTQIFIRLSILCKNFHLLKLSIWERKNKDISVKTHTFSHPLSKACLDD